MHEPKPQGPKQRNISRISWLVFIFGILLVAYHYWLISGFTHTVATVVSVESFRDSSGSSSTTTTYEPTLSFENSNGDTITVKPGYRSSQFNFEQNDKVPIAYNPTRPASFRITSFMSFWALPWVVTLIGTLMVVLTGWKPQQSSRLGGQPQA